MNKFTATLSFVYRIVVFLALIGLVYSVFLLKTKVDNIPTNTSPVASESTTPVEKTATTDKEFSISDCTDCEERIREILSENEGTTKTTTQTVVQTTKSESTTFIPLGGNATVSSTDWTTIDELSAYLDVNGDYGSDAVMTFEASIKPTDGSGTAHIRLWDDTNKIALIGSEMSKSDTNVYVVTKSVRLYPWNGNNLYKVQMKSSTGSSVSVGNANIKIVYTK